jgi:hypothetical protein
MNPAPDTAPETLELRTPPSTLTEYIKLDPRIGELLAEAQRVKPKGLNFCCNAVFFGLGKYHGMGFKPRLKRLAGFLRGTGPEVLQTSLSYEIVYRSIYNALPCCRSCGCL